MAVASASVGSRGVKPRRAARACRACSRETSASSASSSTVGLRVSSDLSDRSARAKRRRRLARAELVLDSELTRKPTVDELASEADLSLEHAEQALAAHHGFTPLDPTDADATAIADPHAGDAYEGVDRRLTRTPLQHLLARLRPAQRRVIELRFGIRGDECSTERTAELLDISPGKVMALEREALHRLRELATPAELRRAG